MNFDFGGGYFFDDEEYDVLGISDRSGSQSHLGYSVPGPFGSKKQQPQPVSKDVQAPVAAIAADPKTKAANTYEFYDIGEDSFKQAPQPQPHPPHPRNKRSSLLSLPKYNESSHLTKPAPRAEQPASITFGRAATETIEEPRLLSQHRPSTPTLKKTIPAPGRADIIAARKLEATMDSSTTTGNTPFGPTPCNSGSHQDESFAMVLPAIEIKTAPFQPDEKELHEPLYVVLLNHESPKKEKSAEKPAAQPRKPSFPKSNTTSTLPSAFLNSRSASPNKPTPPKEKQPHQMPPMREEVLVFETRRPSHPLTDAVSPPGKNHKSKMNTTTTAAPVNPLQSSLFLSTAVHQQKGRSESVRSKVREYNAMQSSLFVPSLDGTGTPRPALPSGMQKPTSNWVVHRHEGGRRTSADAVPPAAAAATMNTATNADQQEKRSILHPDRDDHVMLSSFFVQPASKYKMSRSNKKEQTDLSFTEPDLDLAPICSLLPDEFAAANKRKREAEAKGQQDLLASSALEPPQETDEAERSRSRSSKQNAYSISSSLPQQKPHHGRKDLVMQEGDEEWLQGLEEEKSRADSDTDDDASSSCSSSLSVPSQPHEEGEAADHHSEDGDGDLEEFETEPCVGLQDIRNFELVKHMLYNKQSEFCPLPYQYMYPQPDESCPLIDTDDNPRHAKNLNATARRFGYDIRCARFVQSPDHEALALLDDPEPVEQP